MNKIIGKLINQYSQTICSNENSTNLNFIIYNTNRIKIQCQTTGLYLTVLEYGKYTWYPNNNQQTQDFKIVVYVEKQYPYGIYSITNHEFIGKVSL